MSLGVTELVLILIIVFVIFGAGKLPNVMKDVGKSIKNLKDGKSIALMIDQRVREGEKVNFFGNLATTTTIPAQLIKKYNCDVVPIYIERNNNNYFKMYVSQPIKIKKTKSIKEITLFLNVVLEKMILKNVDQWIWSHDRWKK